MSAFLIGDLRNTVQVSQSLFNVLDPMLSGVAAPSSGVIVGEPVDLRDAGPSTQVYFSYVNTTSGGVSFAVQESDTTTSGDFAGIVVASGESIWLSGGRTGINSSGLEVGRPGGQLLSGVGRVSGGTLYGYFQRGKRYARVIQESGAIGWATPVNAGFIEQKLITGSGFGFSTAPSSGPVSV